MSAQLERRRRTPWRRVALSAPWACGRCGAERSLAVATRTNVRAGREEVNVNAIGIAQLAKSPFPSAEEACRASHALIPPHHPSDPHRPPPQSPARKNGRRRGAGAARKIFVHNCGEFVGSNIAKFPADRRQLRVIGTLRSPSDANRGGCRARRPRRLRRCGVPGERADGARLPGADGRAEAILASIGGAQWEDEVLVGVSSVMTWTRTTPDATSPRSR